jgi:uncharacterized protein YktA (UPF0223 family)
MNQEQKQKGTDNYAAYKEIYPRKQNEKRNIKTV